MNAKKLTTKEIRNEMIQCRNAEINEKFAESFSQGKRADVIFEELGNAYVLSVSQLRRIVKVRQIKHECNG